MAHPRRFRFGIQTPRAEDASEWIGRAKRAEDLGYDLLGVTDHFGDQFAPMPALTAAALVTTRLQVGATVFGNDFKHPVVLAKEMATLDVLSNGRTFLGIGAGWMTADYEKTGISYDPAGTRIDRLIEAIKVMKALFAAGSCTFRGKHYTVSNLDGRPKPVQQPHLPIFIGGGGKRILSLAAREADIVGVNIDLRQGDISKFMAMTATASPLDEKLDWIREAAGSRFDDLELNVIVFGASIGSDRHGAAEEIARRLGVNGEQVLASPHMLVGSVDQVVEELQRQRDRYGISNIFVPGSKMEEFAPVVEHLAGR